MSPDGSGTIKKCDLVRVGVVLLEVCHCGVKLRGLTYAQMLKIHSVLYTPLPVACKL